MPNGVTPGIMGSAVPPEVYIISEESEITLSSGVRNSFFILFKPFLLVSVSVCLCAITISQHILASLQQIVIL